MKEKQITVTEAARNFADCLNRVRYQDTSFVLLKNGKAIAKLVPANTRRCAGRDLAAALARVRLSPQEASAWQKDLKAARKSLKRQADKWQS